MRWTRDEFMQELHGMSNDNTISLGDLTSVAHSENCHVDLMSMRLFVMLADDMMVFPFEVTPLFADRYTVNISDGSYGDRAKAEAQWTIDDHERYANVLRRMADGKGKHGDTE